MENRDLEKLLLLKDLYSQYESESKKYCGSENLDDKKKLSEIYLAMQPLANEYNSIVDKYKLTNSKIGKSKSILFRPISNRIKSLVGCIIVAGASICLNSCTKDESNKESIKIESLDDYQISNLLSSLNNDQRNAWMKIYNFQKYFNLTAAKSVSIKEDEDAELYLTAEECVALYARLNAKEYTAEELSNLFGIDSYYFTDEYLDKNFITASRVLNYYYFTATEKSGLASIFVNKDDADLFEETEKILLEYNKDINNKDNKSKLHDKIMSIYIDASLENAKETASGAYSAIGTCVVPIIHVTSVINSDELEQITDLNEVVTCDILRTFVKEATNIETKTDNQAILSIIPETFNDKNIKAKSRDINFEARYNKLFGNKCFYDGSYVETITETDSSEITRDKAIEEFGEEEVEKAEEEAISDYEEDVEEENKAQADYGRGLEDGANSGIYDMVYAYVLENGVIPEISLMNSGNENYDRGFNEAVQNIANIAYQNAMTELASREESEEQIVDIEETVVTDEELEEELEEELALLLK